MKQIISKEYKRFILYAEIIMAVLMIPLAYNFVPFNKGIQTFYIPSTSIHATIQTLKTNGCEVTWLDKWILSQKQIPEEGWYSIKPNGYGRFFFFLNLHKQKTDETMNIVVYAGETKDELTSRIANDMKLDQQKLLNIYKTLATFEEADILAQRYTIARKADENATMKYIFLASKRSLKPFIQNYFQQTPNTEELKMVYTIASIIQKESNSIHEMPLISSVIYNRLKKGMRLQMDGTLNYGKYAHSIVTPERLKNDQSAYNTYKHKGLPPHPLSTVTIDALKASVNPTKSGYLFFMLNPSGTHDFTENYDLHLANIKSFRTYQKEKKAKEEEMQSEVNNSYIDLSDNKLIDKNNTIDIDWKKISI